MHSFMNNVRRISSKRENLIKESLITNLSNCVKEIQLAQKEGCEVLGPNDSTHTFCTILEAILLHGIKDTLLKKAKHVLSGDIDQPPEPSFWPLLLVFSHREIIDQIQNLQQIATEIGYCRAWVRIAINDCLLSSYLDNMRRDTDALSPYYKRNAFVRDNELLEVAQRYIEGVEACTMFCLPSNSSLLNTWGHPTLAMAGIWSPPLKACPVASGVDVASTLGIDVPKISTNSSLSGSLSHLSTQYMPSPASSLSHIMALNEDEALRIILANKSNELESKNEISNNDHASSMNSTTSADNSPIVTPVEDVEKNDFTTTGNSLIGKDGWSSIEATDPNGLQNVNQASSSSNSLVSSVKLSGADTQNTKIIGVVRTPTDMHSYHALLDSYAADSYSNSPDIRDVWQKLENQHIAKAAESERFEEIDSFGPEILGFEVVPASPSAIFSIDDLKLLVDQLCRLSTEKGLDAQNYVCKECTHPLGINFPNAQVCSFSGEYYCIACMSSDLFVIPARVIHNWDFRRYAVSQRAADFLTDFKHHPLIDIKIVNPLIYTVVEEMAHLQSLRIQLNFLRAYLFTCREPIIEELQKKVWPREYLYEHVHLYSINDLVQIPGGSLTQQLQKIVQFGRHHVTDCWLCSQKGFICEVCNSPKVLYPFNMESTFRCNDCNAVFHSVCLNASRPCPKCERRKKREDMPLFDAITAINESGI